MAMETPIYDTELRLALPGSNEPEQATSSTTSSSVASRKRLSCDSEDSYSIKFDAQNDELFTPPTKAQIVGWPPVQSYRRNSFKMEKQATGSGSGSGLYVKVNMDGAPYLRKIDLKAYTSYVELLEALEGMFKVKIGEYSEREGRYSQSGYAPSYEDKDGDWMLVGDVPWEMFVSSCKRLRIIKSEANRFHI